MNTKNSNIHAVSLFSSFKCNLNCSYCYISQNIITKQIHEEMEQFLKKDAYISDILNFYEGNGEYLTKLELWGGEPLLGLENFNNYIKRYFNTFPNLNEIFTSSNFTVNIDKLLDFIKTLAEISKTLSKHITFSIQISLDGPEEIVDMTRGKNVEKSVRKNLDFIQNELNKLNLGNLKISFMLKPTLSMECVKFLNSDYQNIINYYKYFDNLYDEFEKLNINKNVRLDFPISSSLATPGQYTQEDGITFGIYLDNLNKLSERNESEKLYKHYHGFSFNFIANRIFNNSYDITKKIKKFRWCGAGQASISIGFNGEVSVCHRAIFDSNDEYRKKAVEKSDNRGQKFLNEEMMIKQSVRTNKSNINDINEYDNFLRNFKILHGDNTFALQSIVSNIYELSKCGQISELYNECDNETLWRTIYAILTINPCMYDNAITNSSFYIRDFSLFRLWCNGALENTFSFIDRNKNIFNNEVMRGRR